MNLDTNECATTTEPDEGYDWRAIFDEHSPALYAFLASRTRRREDAEDLLQETFVRAIRATGSVRDRSRLRSYLMTIANNLMINDYRKKRPITFADAGDAADTLLAITAAPVEPTDAAAHWNDLGRGIEAAVEAMTPPLQQAFRLGVLEQRSYDDIARELGWTPGQVRVNVFRARQKAMEQLSSFLPGAGQPA